MDTRKQELKRLKKEYKRAKHKYVTLWKSIGIVFLILILIFTPLCLVVKVFDNTIATFLGGAFWTLENGDENALYFKADPNNAQELTHQVVAEGTVLLMNENGALPLQAGGKISYFGENDLETALEAEGFTVNEVLESVPAYADVAIVQLSSGDTGVLQSLSELKKAGSLRKIVVLLTSENASVLKGNPYGVDAVLWVGQSGGIGKALAEILLGKVNPSGSLPYTFCHNASAPDKGFYTGYRYYETRYEDFVMGVGNAGDYAYQGQVAYPFGFGLSYTAFVYSNMAVTYNEKTDKFEVTLTVTNTGAVTGKETVQVYAQTPYTDYDKQYGVEKASVNLVGFSKTKLLAPGESETVTVMVDKRDLASFDAYGAKTYILDAGKYYLTAATDAHNAVNNILTAKGFTPETTENRMDAVGDAIFTYTWEQVEPDTKTYSVTQNNTAITNRLSVAGSAEGVSRQDWLGTLTRVSATARLPQTEAYDPADYPTVQMPTMGAENGLRLQDLIGLSFDAPQWQTLLDQLTFGDMAGIIGDAYAQRVPVASVNAPGAHETSDRELPIAAATFHTELLYALGKDQGNQMLTEEKTLLRLFAENLSEDGFLAGKLRAAQLQGIQEKSVLALIAPEDNRSLWVDEQAAREVYLRAYRYAFTEGKAAGMVTEADGYGALLTDILQKEWGSIGISVATQSQGAEGVLAGITAYGDCLPQGMLELYQYENDPVIVSAMRQACHRYLYALANSAAMNGIGENTTVSVFQPWFVLVCWIVTPVCAAAFVFFAVMWRRGKKRWKKTEGYLDYKTMKNTLREEKKK